MFCRKESFLFLFVMGKHPRQPTKFWPLKLRFYKRLSNCRFVLRVGYGHIRFLNFRFNALFDQRTLLIDQVFITTKSRSREPFSALALLKSKISPINPSGSLCPCSVTNWKPKGGGCFCSVFLATNPALEVTTLQVDKVKRKLPNFSVQQAFVAEIKFQTPSGPLHANKISQQELVQSGIGILIP